MTEKVILVHLELSGADGKGFHENENAEDLEEFKQLATSAGAEIVGIITGTRTTPDAKYFVGSGKADEIRQWVATQHSDLVILNHALTPAQERNLEKLLQCRVLDRTGLILDIFAQRARTFEGKLQVQLAQIEHLAARLKRGWTHLERQRGGIGLRGGPGETQLEIDRRTIKQKVGHLKERLEQVRSQREQGRRGRKRATTPTIALVGYTNAGKSTLFNLLTQSQVYVADKLFATLDPTLRRMQIPEFGYAVLADTVGFIRHLPHELVKAFGATLEETKEADLLLHIVDAHDPLHTQKIETVDDVLKQIKADKVPQLQIYNKIDLLDNHMQPRIDYTDKKLPQRVWVSAAAGGQGIPLLMSAVRQLLTAIGDFQEADLILPTTAGRMRAKLYEQGAILRETIDDDGNYHLHVIMRRGDLEKLYATSQAKK